MATLGIPADGLAALLIAARLNARTTFNPTWDTSIEISQLKPER